MDPNTLAVAVAKIMHKEDSCALALGIEVLEVRPGFARLCMRIREDMVNGHKIAHGGMIFTLSDTAFAFACSSHNKRAVAAGCAIEFLRATQLGEILTATSTEQNISGRHGIYDVRVTNQDGDLVALFRGKSTQIKGHFVDEADAET